MPEPFAWAFRRVCPAPPSEGIRLDIRGRWHYYAPKRFLWTESDRMGSSLTQIRGGQE